MTLCQNGIFGRLQNIFNYDDAELANIFTAGGLAVTPVQIKDWLKAEEDPGFIRCSDEELSMFLNGLINHKRGKKEGAQPPAEKELTNNMIFRKIKIACDLQADQVLEILDSVEIILSRHELSAFFRGPDHKHYRACNDEVLLGFLHGLQVKNKSSASET
jgi:uncharacterized protein YehS (DUF1456 family)